VLTGIPAIDPVMVSEVIPLGTLMFNVADGAPFGGIKNAYLFSLRGCAASSVCRHSFTFNAPLSD